mmetsp:Transcript_15464/g.25051  ORF Transcript_15464/g.25051 Transcript_15464/m.25051 type:complete len:242 (+) Transcript_15464:360-1085(+)
MNVLNVCVYSCSWIGPLVIEKGLHRALFALSLVHGVTDRRSYRDRSGGGGGEVRGEGRGRGKGGCVGEGGRPETRRVVNPRRIHRLSTSNRRFAGIVDDLLLATDTVDDWLRVDDLAAVVRWHAASAAAVDHSTAVMAQNRRLARRESDLTPRVHPASRILHRTFRSPSASGATYRFSEIRFADASGGRFADLSGVAEAKAKEHATDVSHGSSQTDSKLLHGMHRGRRRRAGAGACCNNCP